MELDIVAEVLGKDIIAIIKALAGKRNVSELALAKAVGRDVNEVRNALYRLHSLNLVSFTRKKDPKKGWYTYFWTFNAANLPRVAKVLKSSAITRLREELERERATQWYACTNGCVRIDFDAATELGFKCPECGSLLQYEDNKKKIAAIERQLAAALSQTKRK